MQPSPQSALAQSILDPSTEVVISMPSFGVVQYFGTRPALEDESLFPATHWPASLAESAWLDGNVSCHLSWDRETERWVFSRSITFASVADACAALKAVRRQTACATTKAAIQQAKADTAFQKFKALCAA